MPRKRDDVHQALRPDDDLYAQFWAELEEAWHVSSLGVWMTANHAELERMMRRGTMDWADAAASFKLAGLRDLRGRFPSAETATETWKRVDERQRVAEARRARRGCTGC